MYMYRESKAIVDVDAIAYNYRETKKHVNKPVIAVVKANAYGHGMTAVATYLNRHEQVDGFAVATLEEAVSLRQTGISCPVLVLGWTSPQYADIAARYDITLTIFQEDWLEQVELSEALSVHLKIDTGMNRLGVKEQQIVSMVEKINDHPYVMVTGAFTHFATADEPENDYQKEQLRSWQRAKEHILSAYRGKQESKKDSWLAWKQEEDTSLTVESAHWKTWKALQKKNEHMPESLLFHVSNSAHTYSYPSEHEDAVRLGISLYGYAPSSDVTPSVPLRPALAVRSVISHCKKVTKGESIGYGATYTCEQDEWIATIPIGYADGILRRHGQDGEVLVNGKRAKIVGRICMDQLMIRCTEEVAVGSDVVLLGKQGQDEIAMDEWEKWNNTISYEMLCALSARLPRVSKIETIMDDYEKNHVNK